MVSHIRKHISTKICDVLKQSSLLINEENVISKINYFTKITTVTKASKKFATFIVNFSDLHDYQLINQSKLNTDIKQKFENLNDDLIKSLKFVGDNKLVIETDVDEFSKSTLLTILNEKDSYGYCVDGEDNSYPRKQGINGDVKWVPKKTKSKTIVEFSSPNIAKPLHAGHMRSTFLGTFLSNIHQRFDHDVTRINYLGDWGTQYGILAVGFKKYGSMEKLTSTPMRHLLDVYVTANKDETMYKDALSHFAKMEAGDEEAMKLWTLFKDLSVRELAETYKKLNIKFDVYEAESEYFRQSKDVVERLVEKNICKKTENNALEVKFDCETKTIKYIVQKADGTTLYITRDIAALLKRKEKYNFNKIIYVVDSAQTDHFKNLYHTMRKLEPQCLGDLEFEQFYVPFGRFTNMSTRAGSVELLSDIINEAKDVALEYMSKARIQKDVEDRELTAQIIGTSHLIVNDFIRPRIKDYKFSWANLLSHDDSGYMIQYAHARLYSLLDRCKNEFGLEVSSGGDHIDFKLLTQPIELILIQHLAKYDEIVWKSFREYEPYVIVQYLFQLVRFVNLSLNENYVTGQEKQLALARLSLYFCCKQVLSNSLKLLNITPLNRI